MEEAARKFLELCFEFDQSSQDPSNRDRRKLCCLMRIASTKTDNKQIDPKLQASSVYILQHEIPFFFYVCNVTLL